MESLVSTDWLAKSLEEDDLEIVDSTWFMPASGRSGRSEYLEAHIPGALFLDIDELRDPNNPLPHMLPTASQFRAAMERLGIDPNNRVVVYDNSPIRTAARGWFMLRHFGARKVAILDGGFQKWTAEGRPTERGVAPMARATFDAPERDDLITKDELLSGVDLPWIDARGQARFEGTEPDPRPGVAPGHAPGARNLPFSAVYREDGTFKGLDEIRTAFREAGVDPLKEFVASCGSGVTANSLIFAAHLLGNDAVWLYDGSWSEWGSDPSTSKLIGAARRG